MCDRNRERRLARRRERYRERREEQILLANSMVTTSGDTINNDGENHLSRRRRQHRGFQALPTSSDQLITSPRDYSFVYNQNSLTSFCQTSDAPRSYMHHVSSTNNSTVTVNSDPEVSIDVNPYMDQSQFHLPSNQYTNDTPIPCSSQQNPYKIDVYGLGIDDIGQPARITRGLVKGKEKIDEEIISSGDFLQSQFLNSTFFPPNSNPFPNYTINVPTTTASTHVSIKGKEKIDEEIVNSSDFWQSGYLNSMILPHNSNPFSDYAINVPTTITSQANMNNSVSSYTKSIMLPCSNQSNNNISQPNLEKNEYSCPNNGSFVPSIRTHTSTYRATLARRNNQFGLYSNIPDTIWMLPSVPNCKYCRAFRFHRESLSFCFSSGRVYLHPLTPNLTIYNLFTSDLTNIGRRFRRRSRTLNNQLALTSIGMKTQTDLCKNTYGAYTVRVNGIVTHRLDPYDPTVVLPNRLQLYFLDTLDDIDPSIYQQYDIDKEVLGVLLEALSANPYFRFFRYLRQWDSLENKTIVLRCDPRLDRHAYSAPRQDQVAAIWDESSEQLLSMDRDIRVYTHGGRSHHIKYHYGSYDPLQYPLLFAAGEPGWHTGIKRLEIDAPIGSVCAGQDSVDISLATSASDLLDRERTVYSDNRGNQENVSCREFICYRAQSRPGERNIIIHSGRLGQQYAIDSYIKLETQRLDYFRLEQNQLDARTETLQGIFDSLSVDGINDPSKVGRRVILPSSFVEGPRDMMQRYVNAMALVNHYGKPDIFITMTCNPKWIEIQQDLCPAETATDRPDLIARVFRAKVEELKDDLIKKHLFGEVAAYVYVIEYQKRGLPHCHWLLIMKEGFKIVSPSMYDEIISAEIPDKDHPFLRSYVASHMMHGPCGDLNRSNVCMENGVCKNKYPKDYADTTTTVENGYPIYRRRNNGDTLQVRGKLLDNRYVVPYSPYLLAKYNCHINVEICSDIRLVKYLYKYIYKGHDKVAYNIVHSSFVAQRDEIKEYQKGRWVSGVEAYWRTFAFELYGMSPPVITLPVHLEHGQFVTYGRKQPLEKVAANSFISRTMLTEYFKMNMYDSDAQRLNLTYKEFPEHFVWTQKSRSWSLRKRGHVIGRLSIVDPTEGERYFLKILLNNVRGATSYDGLKRHPNGITSTFREAALIKGFIQMDTYTESCMEEAATFQMAPSLRRLFAILLVNYSPPNPTYLFDKFYKVMSDDIRMDRSFTNNDVLEQTLSKIDEFLIAQGHSLCDYPLTSFSMRLSESEKLTKEIQYEHNIPVPNADISSIDSLNSKQRLAFNTIVDKFHSKESCAVFIDGPGGTGKTYLYRSLLAYFRSKKLIALAVATSGVAASLLPGGRTAHSRFKLPLQFETKSKIEMSKQCSLARLLLASEIIIWDEASMADRRSIEALDDLLRDLTDHKDQLFGGKIVVLGGDFRQTLPIVPTSSREGMIDACLVSSYIWPLLTKIHLEHNIRAQTDSEYTKYLIRVGEGNEPFVFRDYIDIPQRILFNISDSSDPLSYFIDQVFPDINNPDVDFKKIVKRAILTPRNSCVADINNMLIRKMNGESSVYVSQNIPENIHDQGQYEDYLSTISGGGLPPHELILKINCPIMLIRNINPLEGLTNGTRLICKRLGAHCIGAEIATGDHKGEHVYIPRIPLECDDPKICSIKFRRIQYPVRPCFAMTINKAQGQTLDFAGIYLPQSVFSHGQLYVALSRVRDSGSIRIFVNPPIEAPHLTSATRNVVYNEIFEHT